MSTLGWITLGYLGVGSYFYLMDRRAALGGVGNSVATCRTNLATTNARLAQIDPRITPFDPNDPGLCQPPSPFIILTWPGRFLPLPVSGR